MMSRIERDHNIFLVADDDLFVRSLVSRALKDYGKIVELTNGNDVVDRFLEISPDVLFLDIHLPEKSGLDILDEIIKKNKDAFVVMLSADSHLGNVVITRKAGAKGFITKPFTKQKLLETVRR